jgi:predicted enzyme related to lactoylglutathione lyase
MGNPVVHFDISGPDPAELQSFYVDLFGWKVDPLPGMDYALVDTQAGSGIRGGIGLAREGNGGVTFYVFSEDLQATLNRAESLGGRTTQPVITIPDTTVLAMFEDPAGNPVGLVGAPPGRENERAPAPSPGDGAPVSWFEIVGADAGALVAFYTELFGWEAKQFDMPGEVRYYEVDTRAGSGSAGGIGNNPNGQAYVTVYAEVPNLQATLDHAGELGGKTLMPPMQMPGGPEIAMLADPQGHTFGIYRRA